MIKVAVFTLKDKNGNFLLLKRSKEDDTLPSYWAFIGGGIESGETPEEAVMREAKEEIGIDPKLTFFREYENIQCMGKDYHAFVFIGELEHSLELLKKQQTEGETLGLFSPDEIKELKIHDGDKVIWKDIIEAIETKYWRRVAIFTLMDESNRLLLQHRDTNTPQLPNCWGFFGGGIERDETPKEAVMREAKEELAIEPKLTFFRRYELVWTDKLIETFVFVGKLDYSLKDLKKQQIEGDNLSLFSKEEIQNLTILTGDKIILKDIFENEKE